jgi:hypothetical protein
MILKCARLTTTPGGHAEELFRRFCRAAYFQSIQLDAASFAVVAMQLSHRYV